MLIALALVAIPVLLLVKPLVLRSRHNQVDGREDRAFVSLNGDSGSGGGDFYSNGGAHGAVDNSVCIYFQLIFYTGAIALLFVLISLYSYNLQSKLIHPLYSN